MKCHLIILLLLVPTVTAHGQYLRLWGDSTRTALYLDAGRIWNYNLYEHSRWGAGLRLTTAKVLSFDGHLGYGTYDEQWKYGAAITGRFLGSRREAVYLRYLHDYFAVGSRHIDSPEADNFSLLGSFWSRRMTEQQRVTLGYRWSTAFADWAIEAVWEESGRLFDAKQLLYYNRGDAITHSGYIYSRLLMCHHLGLRLQTELGNWGSDGPAIARLLTDYRKTFHWPVVDLHLYAQAGLTPPSADYEHMFDLGGTWDAPVYIGNNLPTIHPNEFTANSFALLRLRLQTAPPLYHVYNNLFNVGSSPRPFVGFTALWGTMWGQDSNGLKNVEEFVLQSPYKGLLEPILGVDGIIRWGMVDCGVAVTYRLTPSSATYHIQNRQDNFMLLISFKLAD